VQMVKIAAIVGDYYHKGDWAKESLEAALTYSSLKNTQVEYHSYEQIKDVLAEQPDAVILFKENRLNPTDEKIVWMTEELGQEITNYVSNGGGWLAWHSGLASYPARGSYTAMLRGHFLYHPEKHQIVHYKSSNNSSFLPAAVSFEAMDEHYFVHCDEENTSIFLTSDSIDGNAIAGWSHSYGNGKVCCLTPSHNKEGLLHPEFLTILGSCLNWINKD
jgi:type 1 glutamine amidotransferase